MRKYSLAFRFSLLCQLLFLFPICCRSFDLYCFLLHVETTRQYQFKGDVFVLKRMLPIRSLNSYQFKHNTKFVQGCLETDAIITFSLWLWVLLIMSGDVHPNPGPASTSSISTSSSSLHDCSISKLLQSFKTPIIYPLQCTEYCKQNRSYHNWTLRFWYLSFFWDMASAIYSNIGPTYSRTLNVKTKRSPWWCNDLC